MSESEEVLKIPYPKKSSPKGKEKPIFPKISSPSAQKSERSAKISSPTKHQDERKFSPSKRESEIKEEKKPEKDEEKNPESKELKSEKKEEKRPEEEKPEEKPEEKIEGEERESSEEEETPENKLQVLVYKIFSYRDNIDDEFWTYFTDYTHIMTQRLYDNFDTIKKLKKELKFVNIKNEELIKKLNSIKNTYDEILINVANEASECKDKLDDLEKKTGEYKEMEENYKKLEQQNAKLNSEVLKLRNDLSDSNRRLATRVLS